MCLKAQVRFVSDKDAGVTLKIICSGGVEIPVRYHPQTHIIYELTSRKFTTHKQPLLVMSK